MSRWSRTERILALTSVMVFVCAASASGLHAAQRFERGDSNADGRFDISDAVNTLAYLFLGTPASLPCLDAADSNDDGTVDISDASHALGNLFLGTTAPPAPFGDCGEDPIADALGCEGFAPCPAPSVQIRISGLLQLPDGTPAAGARVRTTLGGETIAGANGAFALEVEGPVGAIFSVVIAHEAGARRYAKSVRAEVREGVESVDLGAMGLVDVSVDIFEAHVEYDVEDRSRSVALGDLDGDGDADLAVAKFGTDTVSILQNQGDGRFEAHVQYGVGGRPIFVALGDLDGDGDADLAVAHEYSLDSDPPGVSVLRNQGDGTFEAHVEYDVGGSSGSIALRDIDGDGDADLAVTNGSSRTVSVLRNQGDGTFEAHVDYAVDDVGGGPTSVALGDLDGDGDADLAVVNARLNITVSVLRNQGDGTFEGHVEYGVGTTELPSLALGDLDGDGDADLAVASAVMSGGLVSVLRNRGDGTFDAAVVYAAGNPYSLALGDLDGDGDTDIVVANWVHDTVSVLRNQGDGTFEAHVQYGVGDGSPNSVALGDLDGDGDADLAAAKANSSTVSILLNQTVR